MPPIRTPRMVLDEMSRLEAIAAYADTDPAKFAQCIRNGYQWRPKASDERPTTTKLESQDD